MGIKERRTSLRLSLVDLGRRCGIHPVTLCRLESGTIKMENITLRNAVRLADALGCDPRDLLADTEVKQ